MRRTRLHTRAPFLVSMPAVCLALVCSVLGLAGCGDSSPEDSTFVATIPPVAAILNELIRGRAEVSVLVPPGASPHTYSLRPSGARQVSAAKAVFFVDAHFDGWAASLGEAKQVSLFAMVPPEFRIGWESRDHADSDEEFDPHFWPDPLAVRAIVPRLVKELIALDPEGAAIFEENGEIFGDALERLDAEIRDALKDAVPASVVVFHPSWNYYLARYGISVAAAIEPMPGHEPTPRHIQQIAELIERGEVRAVLTEPQLPKRAAEVVAERSDVRIVEIDPIGGVEGRKTYVELLRYNTRALAEALR